MNVRWSDFVAVSAIAVGAMVPIALTGAFNARAQAGDYMVLTATELHFDYEEPAECVSVEAVRDRLMVQRKAFLREQAELMALEATKMRRAAEGVRSRVQAELALHTAELEADPERAEAVRREALDRATEDLIRLGEARADAEAAMALAELDLQEELLEIEAQLAELDEQHKKKRKRRRHPCRRPGRRHPGR